MGNTGTMARLKKVFRNVFQNPNLNLTARMTAKDVRGWDSIKHIALIVAVEKEFKIRFTTKEILSFADVGCLAEAIEKKIA